MSRESVARTAFSYETSRLTRLIVTRQALKTLLKYLVSCLLDLGAGSRAEGC